MGEDDIGCCDLIHPSSYTFEFRTTLYTRVKCKTEALCVRILKGIAIREMRSKLFFSSGLCLTWQVRRLSLAGGLFGWEHKWGRERERQRDLANRMNDNEGDLHTICKFQYQFLMLLFL